MGEIYRAASVSGVRRLDDQRDQQSRQGRKNQKGKSVEASTSATTAAARPPADTSVSQGPGTSAGRNNRDGLDAELTRLDDLCAIQEKRIAQLESEKEELLRDLSEIASELRDARQRNDQEHDLETSAGYEAGLQQARGETEQERKKLAAEVKQLKKLFSGNLEGQLQKVDEFAIEIAFAALTRIVGERFGDEVFAKAVVSRAVDSVRGTRKVAIHVAQQDFDLMKQFGEEITSSGQISEVEFVADPRVTVGGCMIETETGVWDARLETQLQRLRDAIEASSRSRD